MRPSLTGYLDVLKALPFVESASVEQEQQRVGDVIADVVLSIQTPSGKRRLYADVKSSNLSMALAEQVVSLAQRLRPLIVLSPAIGAGLGNFLFAHETSFVDLRGNCYVNLGGRYLALIQGRAGPTPAHARSWRTPAYQVLFTLLADPLLLSSPVRRLAAAAGVSRQPAQSVRKHLVDLGHLARKGRSYAWLPLGRKRAMDLWLASYGAAVRPSLLVGTYRTMDADPERLEARIGAVLDEACTWRWGGGAAAQRLTGHYRGDKTLVHLSDAPADLAKRLQAIPDSAGPLVLLHPPGPAGMMGATPDTAHPLLVYSELLADGSDRAREAAEHVAQKHALGLAT